MHHFVTEKNLILAAAACILLLALHLGFRWRAQRERAARDDWARADKRSRIREEDEFTDVLRKLRREHPLESVHTTAGKGSLPTAEARTQAMAALGAGDDGPPARAEAPPEYGWATRGPVRSDIPRSAGLMSGYPVAGVSRDLEVSDAITGQIVKVVPEDDYPSDPRASTLLRVADEWRTEWHWVGGELHPPTSLTDMLPADDWLRELLLVAA